MENIIKQISQYLNRRRCKGLYDLNIWGNDIIRLRIGGKLEDKINNNDKFYHEFSDFIEDLGLEMDLVDVSTIDIWVE